MTATPASRTALVAGATGAVGAPLVQQLLAEPAYTTVKVLSRRPQPFMHRKLRVLPLEDDGATALGAELAADDVFCCLGTTQKKAGSRAAFERVDYHLVLDVARAALAQGARQFLVVSAAGTSASSPSFYSRVKARMEQAVGELAYPTIHILRPSLLLAKREDSRPAEWLGQKLAPVFNPLLRGQLAIYRAVTAEDVAAAMVRLALRELAGKHTHHFPVD